ncbi:MAG: phosphoribosylglycinamide formyltransferase [Desulfobacteraceae bacterium]|nr:phosphoribosylglycinamide formyltransferase [Desulfobacteraceae bacterium]
MNKIRIGALISGGGTNLQAIIDACDQNRIQAEMVFVGADNHNAYGLDRASKHNIPTFIVDYRQIIQTYRRAAHEVTLPEDFDIDDIRQKQYLLKPDTNSQKADFFLSTRAAAEAQLLEKIAPYSPDLLILAGFMRNLTPYFIDRFNTDAGHPRIMNIHPALLPAFPGTDGYGDTYRYGCKVAGCTVHFIDYGEDSGPIIGQKAFPILENDTLESVQKKGLELEWQLYPECIQLFAQGRLHVASLTHLLPNNQVVQRCVVKIAQNA